MFQTASTIVSTVCSKTYWRYSSGTPPQTPSASGPEWLWSLWITMFSARSTPPVRRSTSLRMSTSP